MSKLFEPVESEDESKKAGPPDTTYALGEEFPY